MERKIGKRFNINGITIEIVETEYHSCDNCAFFEQSLEFCNNIKCADYERFDGKNIYFKEITQ